MVLTGASERAETIPHETFPRGNVPFRHEQELGRGGYAIVDEVKLVSAPVNLATLLNGRSYARKVLRLSMRQSVDRIVEEIHIMRSLHHTHIANIIFTYEELPQNEWQKGAIGIIMEPVADCNLKEFMEMIDSRVPRKLSDQEYQALKRWFNCLASGLAFIHSKRIRHKDIKPANILIKGDKVYYSDFGISEKFPDNLVTSKTVGDPFPRTPMYCAPEVAAEQPRGRKADVFSLGCVFLEMLTIVCRKSFGDFAAWRGSSGSQAYHVNHDLVLRWLLQFYSPIHKSNRLVAFCCATLNPSPIHRIASQDLAEWSRCVQHLERSALHPELCECVGHEHFQPFRAVLVGGVPRESALDISVPVSWDIAQSLWIGWTQWKTYQHTTQSYVQLCSIEPPRLVEQVEVEATAALYPCAVLTSARDSLWWSKYDADGQVQLPSNEA